MNKRQTCGQERGGRPLGPVAAFTLIEIMISATLMSLILVAAYLCLNAGLVSKKLVEPRADLLQNARVAVALVAADLRGACPLDRDYAFLGMQRTIGSVEADNLDFATHNYTPRHAGEGDWCEVSYYVEQDEASGRFSLWRRRNPALAPDPLKGGRKEEIARDLRGIRFEYSDGVDWYDSWGEVKGQAKAANSLKEQPNLSGMPAAVRITLLLDSNPKSPTNAVTGERTLEPPLAFQTVARLNLADISNASGSGADTASAATDGGQDAATPGGGAN